MRNISQLVIESVNADNPTDFSRNSWPGLPEFGWPGGYPLLYTDVDGAILCAKCASKANISQEVTGWFIHYEGEPEQCEDCNKFIESAHGPVDNS